MSRPAGTQKDAPYYWDAQTQKTRFLFFNTTTVKADTHPKFAIRVWFVVRRRQQKTLVMKCWLAQWVKQVSHIQRLSSRPSSSPGLGLFPLSAPFPVKQLSNKGPSAKKNSNKGPSAKKNPLKKKV